MRAQQAHRTPAPPTRVGPQDEVQGRGKEGVDETRKAAAQRTARVVRDLVGDGCVVRLHDRRERALRVAAVDHREGHRRDALAPLLESPAVAVEAGWAGHCFSKNLPFRLEGVQAAEAAWGDEMHALGLEPELSGAIVAPLRFRGEVVGVVTALRDTERLPYTLRDQYLAEELAVDDAPPEDPAPALERVGLLGEGDALRVLEHAPTGIWVTSNIGETTFINERVSQLLGRPSSEVLGNRMGDFLDGEPRLVAGGIALHQEERSDRRLTRPDGVHAWVGLVSHPLVDEQGRRRGTVTTVVEATERKQTEIALRLRAAAGEAVSEIAQRALAGEGLESLLAAAAEAAGDIVGADGGGICEVVPDSEIAIPLAIFGFKHGTIGAPIPLPHNSPGSLSLDDDEPVIVTDFASDTRPEAPARVTEHQLRSAAYARIAGGAGFIGMYSFTPRAFGRHEAAFLGTLASVLTSRWDRPPATAPAPGEASS